MNKNAILLLMVSPLSFCHAAELLTPNLQSSAFPGNLPRCAAVERIVWDESQSDASLVKTAANKRRGISSLFDGELIGDGESAVWGTWSGKSIGVFTLELTRPVIVEKLDLWSSEKPPAQGIGRVSIALSRDDKSYTEVLSKNCALDDDGKVEESAMPFRHELPLERPAVARYVRVKIEKNPNRHQMVLAECALWGRDIGDEDEGRWSIEAALPVPKPTASAIGAGAVMLDWSDYAGGDDVEGFRVYCISRPSERVNDVKRVLVATLPRNRRSYVFYPVNTTKKHFFAVTAMRRGGEDPRINSLEWKVEDPLKCETFGDMLGINNYWGGGGANEGKINDHYYEIVLDMLRDSPFKRIRWWINPETIVKKYYQRGIEVTGASGNDVEAAIRLGVKLHGHVNEPHLQSITPEQLVKSEHEARAKFLAMAGKSAATHRFYGPEIGLDNASFEYLHRYLAAGGAENVDILDFHTYIGGTAEFEQPKGYPTGSPEALAGRVAKLKEILKKYKVDKPLMCSEFGYSDVTVSNPHVKDMTPAKKAAYLVRGTILHYVCGFKRLFLYSFYDEGTNPVNSEHHFGIVTRDLQKKPAYYALCTMGKVLGDAVSVRTMRGTANVADGIFGYNFTLKDRGNVSVIWDGRGDKIGSFRGVPGEVTVISMMGEKRQVATGKNGEFSLRFGGEPVYILSEGEIYLRSSKVATDDSSGSGKSQEIAVSPVDEVVIGCQDEAVKVSLKIANPTSKKVEFNMILRDGSGKVVSSRMGAADAKSQVKENFVLPQNDSILDRCSVDVDYVAGGENKRASTAFFIRKISPQTTNTSCKKVKVLDGKHEYVRLCNDKLEVLFSPECGGAIIDLHDKRTMKNQLNIDYSAIDNLAAIDFAYGLWDRISATGEVKSPADKTISRRTPLMWKKIDDGVAFEGDSNGCKVVKEWKLRDNTLVCTLRVANDSPRNVNLKWYLHPEWTPGGVADSYGDYIVAPLEDDEFKMAYWSGLGERKLGKLVKGECRIVDPQNNYQILQKHERDLFENPRLWFGIGTMNVEMTLKPFALKKNSEMSANISWSFSN